MPFNASMLFMTPKMAPIARGGECSLQDMLRCPKKPNALPTHTHIPEHYHVLQKYSCDQLESNCVKIKFTFYVVFTSLLYLFEVVSCMTIFLCSLELTLREV